MFFPGKVLYLSVLKQRTEAVTQRWSVKKGVLFRKIHKKASVPESLFRSSCRLRPTREGKKFFICNTPSIKEFLNFLAGWRIIYPKSVKFLKKWKLQFNIFKWSCALVFINNANVGILEVSWVQRFWIGDNEKYGSHGASEYSNSNKWEIT